MDERELLEGYVNEGKLMQLSTIDEHGAPAVCSVWYLARFRPDRLLFLSRHDRAHSHNIRRNSSVAGAIVHIPIHELGQVARGVSFSGRARQLPAFGIEDQAEAFVQRWPKAAPVLNTLPHSASRLYEIIVIDWVLFDEQNFPTDPRRAIPGT